MSAPHLRCWCENEAGDEIGCPVHDNDAGLSAVTLSSVADSRAPDAPLTAAVAPPTAAVTLHRPDEALAERRLDWLGEQAWEPEDWS